MTTPLVQFTGVVKSYGGSTPLRIESLSLQAGDRCILTGLDAMAAEMFMHVLTGAALPEAGRIDVFGRSTHDISTDTEWLDSLDRFGLVSNRAVLLDQSTVAQNLALPLTLSIDPMADDIRAAVVAMAREVALAPERLDAPAASLTPAERVRVHLARALATSPAVLLLEHPTATAPEDGAAFGAKLREVSASRQLTWLAISDDPAFHRASGGQVLAIDTASGAARARGGFWQRWFGR